MTDQVTADSTDEVPQLLRQVVALANEAHRIAAHVRAAELTGLLAAQAKRWGETTATIVVAGAQKRGKSRLLNALVGYPDLLPVDADIATHTHVVLRSGPSLEVTVERQVDGQSQLSRIEPAELPDYASVIGDPVKRQGVTQVDVTLDSPLLSGIRLVDTPGVDSLTTGHRDVTVATLSSADALLFAVSAQDQPLLRHELEFLVEAADRVEAITFVMTKIDDSDSWPQLIEENRARLAEFLQLPAPGDPGEKEARRRRERLLAAAWLPVSAATAEKAAARAAAGNAARAAQLRGRSGFTALAAQLEAYGRARQLVRSSQLLAVVTKVLEASSELYQERAAGAARDPQVQERLAAEQERLDALQAHSRSRRRAMAGASRVSSEVGQTVRARIDAVRQEYQREVGAAPLQKPAQLEAFLDRLPDSLEKSLQAAWLDIVAAVLPAFRAELADLLAELGVAGEDFDLDAVDAPVRLGEIVRRQRQSTGDEGTDLLVEGLPVVMSSASLAGVLSHLAVLGPFGWVAAPVAILELARRRRRASHRIRARGEIMRHIGDVLGLATGEMTIAIQGELGRRRLEIEETVDSGIAAQRRDIDQRRQELSRLARRDEAERQKAAADAQTQLATIAQVTRRVADSRLRVTAALERMLAAESATRPAIASEAPA